MTEILVNSTLPTSRRKLDALLPCQFWTILCLQFRSHSGEVSANPIVLVSHHRTRVIQGSTLHFVRQATDRPISDLRVNHPEVKMACASHSQPMYHELVIMTSGFRNHPMYPGRWAREIRHTNECHNQRMHEVVWLRLPKMLLIPKPTHDVPCRHRPTRLVVL